MSKHPVVTGGRALAVALPLCWAAPGCRATPLDQDSYVMKVNARAVDGLPVPGLVVFDDAGRMVGRSEMEGRVLFRVAGRENEAVSFRVRAPVGMKIADGHELRKELLRPLRLIGGSVRGVNLIEHDVTLRRSRLRYPVLLAAGAFRDLPVTVYGVERTRLNSHGAALFTYEGQAGDDLTVTLMTDAEPRIVPISPQKTWVLPATPAPLVWRPELSLRMIKTVKRVRPPRRGPQPL